MGHAVDEVEVFYVFEPVFLAIFDAQVVGRRWHSFVLSLSAALIHELILAQARLLKELLC